MPCYTAQLFTGWISGPSLVKGCRRVKSARPRASDRDSTCGRRSRILRPPVRNRGGLARVNDACALTASHGCREIDVLGAPGGESLGPYSATQCKKSPGYHAHWSCHESTESTAPVFCSQDTATSARQGRASRCSMERGRVL